MSQVSRAARPGSSQDGIALILTLILTVLLYVLVAELVTTARLSRLTGDNDALLARMRSHQEFTLEQIEEQLRDDLTAATEGEGEGGAGSLGALGGGAGAGAGGGAGAGAGAGAGGGAGEQGGEKVDSSQDAWYEPTAHADEDITTYVWVEDENRKFNVLSLMSPDPEFAREQRECFVRLIDALREDTEFDLSSSDGEKLADEIIEWMRAGGRSEDLDRPPLKSDGYGRRSDSSLPVHLDELLLLPSVKLDLFQDKVLDDRLIPGLESVLTVYTSLKMDSGDPDKLARRERRNARAGARAGGAEAGGGGQPAAAGSGGAAAASNDPKEAEQPMGLGIRLNINTMTRPMFRAVLPPEVSDAVVDAILRYRNEEEEPDPEAEGGGENRDAVYSDFDPGETPKKKIFSAVEDLEKVQEFANVASNRLKEKLYPMLTVQSDVFTIHMASMFKRNEERRIYTLRRCKSVLVRVDSGDEPALHPLVLLEECEGLRVQPVDFPDEFRVDDFNAQLDDMDAFSAEERRWNPFFLEFYRVYEDGEAR